MHPAAGDHRRDDLHLGELRGLAREGIAVEHDEVGEPARDERAAAPLVMAEPRRSNARRVQRLAERECLLGPPRRPVVACAQDAGDDTGPGVELLDRRVRAVRDERARVEQRAKRVCALELVPPEALGEVAMGRFKEMYSQPAQDHGANAGPTMTGFYVMNNAGIGLRCFAAGLLLGVGGLFALVFNAVQLGAVFGYMLTVDERANFMEFVTAHGPFELTAVVFSAAAGMRLGFSLVATGGLSRAASLRRAAVEATPVIGAAVVLFCLAALIEGFVSPSAAPYAAKAAVAVLSTAMLLFYVVALGYSGGE